MLCLSDDCYSLAINVLCLSDKCVALVYEVRYV